MNGEKLVVNDLRYFGVVTNNDGEGKSKIECRIMQGRALGGVLIALLNRKNLSVVCAKCLHDGMFVLTLKYGCEPLVFIGPDRLKIRAVQIRKLCRIDGIKKIERVKKKR